MDRLRIRIVGGSLGGLFAAALLGQDGHDVKIYERSARGLGGRGAGLLGRSDLFALLRATGCEHVANVGVVAQEGITFDRAGGIVERNGKPSMEISWNHLYQFFREQLPDGAYQLGAEVRAVTQDADRVYLTFNGLQDDWADLVIGADGVGSTARTTVNGPGSASLYAGYVAWRGLFPERLLDLAVAGPLLGYLAYYPMPGSHIIGFLVDGPNGEAATGSRRYNWVWYRPAPGEAGRRAVLTDGEGVAHPYSLPPGHVSGEAARALVAQASELLPPAFASVVAAEPRPFVQAIFDYETPAMARGRVALLGDSAFTVRPHTGRGAAKAAGDALALQRVLRALPVREALQAYHTERHPIGLSIAAHGRELGARLLGR